MSTLSHNNAVRKLLHVAAIVATFACVSGASLVASATTSPVMAQDITGTEDAEKIDKLQHGFDPAHYPKKKEAAKEEKKEEEPGRWERFCNWVCSFFSSDEEDKKAHEEALKKAVEERRKELGSEKKPEAPKPETKTSESRTTGFVKPVETVKAGAIKVDRPVVSKVETIHVTPALKVEASHVEAFKSPALKPVAITQTKSLVTTPAAHPLPAMTMPMRSASLAMVKH
jgi:hypothetical protein